MPNNKTLNQSLSKQLEMLEKILGANPQATHFCITQNNLSDFLFPPGGLLPSQSFAGWRIKYKALGQISFTQVQTNGNEVASSEEIIVESQYILHNVNGSTGGQITQEDFFPEINYINGPPKPIGFYFLNKAEYDIAAIVGIQKYCFSVSYILPNNFHLPVANPVNIIPTLKIECKYGYSTAGGVLPSSSPDSPTMILAPPCPPVWKPGYRLPKTPI